VRRHGGTKRRTAPPARPPAGPERHYDHGLCQIATIESARNGYGVQAMSSASGWWSALVGQTLNTSIGSVLISSLVVNFVRYASPPCGVDVIDEWLR
jgi:hypothetical protein